MKLVCMEKARTVAAVLALFIFAAAGAAVAEPGHMGGGMHGMKGAHGGYCDMKKDHMGMGQHWKYTLTDEQKARADKMHLELKKSMAVLKERLGVAKAELALLVVSDKPDTAAINRKIDDILAIKKEMMRKKYSHKVEMRGILTPEQRVSFDMHVVSGSGGKDGRGHGKKR